jgi:GntR family transcriptional regulator
MLSRVMLDRNMDVPLFRQLRAALEMRIIDGELRDGTPLPSIRRMANDLDVATVTVVQAYKELQAHGYIQSVPKRGFFVTSGYFSQPSIESNIRVVELIDLMFDAARETGIGEKKAAQLVLQRLHERQSRPKTIAIVGFRDASLSERVAHTRTGVADLSVSVIGLSFEKLEAMDGEELDDLLQPIDVFLVSVGEVRHASLILGKHAVRILPMTRELRADVVAAIQRQPEDTRFGVIANSHEYADRIIAEFRRVHPASITSSIAIVDDTIAVHRVLERSDVILIGSLAGTRLEVPIAPELDRIEFIFVPDADTLNKLRGHLTRPEFAPLRERLESGQESSDA